MRDPARIDGYMEKLGDLWHEFPDMRFGQFLMNTLGDVQNRIGQDLFFVEDPKFFATLEIVVNDLLHGRNGVTPTDNPLQ